MTDKELAVIDVLCGNSKAQWSLCDTSCSGCNFYFEDSDMGAVVPICIHGFGKSRNSCDYYMTHQEYSQLVRSCLANFKAENAKLVNVLHEVEEDAVFAYHCLQSDIEHVMESETEFFKKWWRAECRNDNKLKRIEVLESENSKLREQIHWLKRGDVLHVLTDQELADQQKHEREMQASITALDAENAKLREFAKEACEAARDFYNLGGTFNDLDDLICEAHELGIEV